MKVTLEKESIVKKWIEADPFLQSQVPLLERFHGMHRITLSLGAEGTHPAPSGGFNLILNQVTRAMPKESWGNLRGNLLD